MAHKIFISYKRNVEPDSPVANAVYEALHKDYNVFIDITMGVGQRWAEQIEKEIKASDFFIPFLSEYSIHSEMVVAEIETAYYHHKNTGKPIILPVRLNYHEPFVYPLSAWLNPINWAFWESNEDTLDLIEELVQAISGGQLRVGDSEKEELVRAAGDDPLSMPYASAQPIKLERPEGTMQTQSAFYIDREADKQGIDAVVEEGVTITIKGPRQMGKSSLLNRLMSKAIDVGKHVAFLDFQMVEKSALADADTFFRLFCCLVTEELGLEDQTASFWQKALGNLRRSTNYFQQYLLKEIDGTLVLAMDEVERVFNATFRADFFSMLRSWHNHRAIKPDWRRVDLALVTSTEPYQFIDDLNQSPFNVGTVLNLEDFTFSQVSDLNQRHGTPFKEGELEALFEILAGHPYLTRKALFLVAKGLTTAQDLLVNAVEEHGPFGDHLRNHFYRMHEAAELVTALHQVLREKCCDDDEAVFRLRGAGLVKRQNGTVIPRNKLYAEFFMKYLYG
jgi:hypothetical protein